MGRILYRNHVREIGVEEDIGMIFDHNHLHDYGVRTRNGGNGGQLRRLPSPAVPFWAALAARWPPPCCPPKRAPQVPQPNG